MREGTLIPPMPKEYLAYSNKEKLEKTEKYYQKISDLYQRMDVSRNGYRERLDCILQNEVSLKEMKELFMEKEAQILCLYDYDFYILKLLWQIAETEENFHIPHIIQNIKSIEDAVYWYQRCVFLLRRFELDWEEDEELYVLVKENKVSYICLAELICGEGIVCKIHTAAWVAQYFYKNGLIKEAILFLMWLEKQLPYSERKIMQFTMTLLDWGERQLAYEILMKHQNPDQDIKELQTALREML